MLRTTILLGALTGIIMVIGQLLGGSQGLTIAFIFAVIMNFGSYWFSDKIVLAAYGARPIGKAEALWFFGFFRTLKLKAGFPIPKVFLFPSAAANNTKHKCRF